MAKQRKTRKEKIRSTIRQQSSERSDMQTQSPGHVHTSFSYKLPLTSAHSPTKPTVSLLSYDYIAHDLKHTLFITGSIILAQIILFVLLQAR